MGYSLAVAFPIDDDLVALRGPGGWRLVLVAEKLAARAEANCELAALILETVPPNNVHALTLEALHQPFVSLRRLQSRQLSPLSRVCSVLPVLFDALAVDTGSRIPRNPHAVSIASRESTRD